jgi:hypothetical protein
MSDLEALYRIWHAKPFPPGSGVEVLGELHADLALADTWIADTVIPFMTSGIFNPAKLDVIGELRKLRAQAVKLRDGAVGEERALADAYRDYADLLVQLYAAFLACTGDLKSHH